MQKRRSEHRKPFHTLRRREPSSHSSPFFSATSPLLSGGFPCLLQLGLQCRQPPSKFFLLFPSRGDIVQDGGRAQQFARGGAQERNTEFDRDPPAVLGLGRYCEQLSTVLGDTRGQDLVVALPVPGALALGDN